MKPEKDPKDDEPDPVTGDVIGNTAYSERFVLKILLKLANLDSLKEDMQETSFEDDLCTLWDMTAENDVVLFLQKHDVLKLIKFALPIIESPRIIEIIVGIIGNMCCLKEVVVKLLAMEDFLKLLLEYIKTDDSLVLIQLLRLINTSIFLALDDDSISTWIGLFESIGYSEALYFILKNSSNKSLVITALENFNSITCYCNIETTRTQFFTQFVTLEAIESLCAAFTEIIVTQKDLCEKEEFERVLVISLQIILNIVGFESSPEIFSKCNEKVIKMIQDVMNYYEDKLVNQKEIDSDLVDVMDSTNTIIKILILNKQSEMESYFSPCYSMWKALNVANKSHQNGHSDFEDNSEELAQFSRQLKVPLCSLLCNYILECPESQLLPVLDTIGDDYDHIVNEMPNEQLRLKLSQRTTNFRTRLKDDVES